MSSKCLLNLNSRNRDESSVSSTNFQISIQSTHVQRVKSCRLKSVSFCNCAYNINQYNNTFSYFDGAYETITVPVGQYTLANLLTQLESLFLLDGITIDLQVNALTNKVEVTSCVPAIKFYDYDGSNENPLGIALGIVGDSGLVATTQFQNFPDISGLYVANIISSKLSQDDGVLMRKVLSGSSIIQQRFNADLFYSIPVSSAFLYQEVYENNSDLDLTIYTGDARNFSSIDIQLVDAYNRVIDLNGTDVNIVLEITYDE